MCDTHSAEVAPVEPSTLSAEWSGEVLALEPVDELAVLTVCDNVCGYAAAGPAAGQAALAERRPAGSDAGCPGAGGREGN